jgi:hypothetical protein
VDDLRFEISRFAHPDDLAPDRVDQRIGNQVAGPHPRTVNNQGVFLKQWFKLGHRRLNQGATQLLKAPDQEGHIKGRINNRDGQAIAPSNVLRKLLRLDSLHLACLLEFAGERDSRLKKLKERLKRNARVGVLSQLSKGVQTGQGPLDDRRGGHQNRGRPESRRHI